MPSPKKRKSCDEGLRRPSELTEDEWAKVTTLVAEGLTFPAIGNQLGVSTANGALNNAYERYMKKHYCWTKEHDTSFRDWLSKAMREGSTKLGIPKAAMEARITVKDVEFKD